MSNIHELIQIVNGFFQFVGLVWFLRVMKQWFTCRADAELHIISEAMNCISLGDSTFRPHDPCDINNYLRVVQMVNLR